MILKPLVVLVSCALFTACGSASYRRSNAYESYPKIEYPNSNIEQNIRYIDRNISQAEPFVFYGKKEHKTYSYQDVKDSVEGDDLQAVMDWIQPWETFENVNAALEIARERKDKAEQEHELEQRGISNESKPPSPAYVPPLAINRSATPNRPTRPDCKLSLWDITPLPGPWKILTFLKIEKIRKLRNAGFCR